MALYLLIWSILFFFVNIVHVATAESLAVHEKICHSCADGGDSITCYCDNTCTLYNDCCFDAPTMSRRFQENIRFSCFPLFLTEGVYLIDGCKRQWRGSATVRNKCESPNDFSDLSMVVPVTDTFTNITYRNVYCAQCNNIGPYSLSPFALSAFCGQLLTKVNDTNGNITDDFIIQNIIHVNNSWGVYHWDQYLGDMAFVPCSLNTQLPESLSSAVRSCDIRMVSTCADDWNLELTRHRCWFSNKHIVYDTNGTLYRNEHCAICNYMAANNISCFPPVSVPGFGAGGSGFFLGFYTVLKFKDTCAPHQIYDSESVKCRRFFCPDPDRMTFYGNCVNKGN